MLARWCGISRLAYNTCLMKWNADYRDSVAKHNYYSIKKWFNSIKYERFPFIAECSKWVPEAAIKDLQTGFTNLFRHRGNHPKLHRKGRNDSFRIDGSVVRIDGKTVRLPKRLTVRMMERIPNEGRITKINNVTVSHKAGLWFISINYETDMNVRENQATGIVGIDLGAEDLGGLLRRNNGGEPAYPAQTRTTQETLATHHRTQEKGFRKPSQGGGASRTLRIPHGLQTPRLAAQGDTDDSGQERRMLHGRFERERHAQKPPSRQSGK